LEPFWERVHERSHGFLDLVLEDRLVRDPVVLGVITLKTSRINDGRYA
jgi:hypothetical protein